MTDTIDLNSLTPEQQATLQDYTAVTAQDLKDAIPLLQRTEWNLQIAITRFFDGEPTNDPVADAMAAGPADIRRQETLMQGFAAPNPAQIRGIDVAPRIVPQPADRAARTLQPPILLRLLFSPFSILYAILSRSFNIIGRIFPFLPQLLARITGPPARPTFNSGGRTPLKPRDSAARFIREFQEQYGDNELPFLENGYAQALDLAKQELKYLLVLLVSPDHDDTPQYVQETLLNPEVVQYLKNPQNNIILWAGNVQDSEAFQVAEALKCTKFPFAALICHTPVISSTAMSVIARITGPTPPTQFLEKIRDAMQMHGEGLTRARRSKQEQQATRSLRDEQNSAYERSLAQDKERARVKREAAERAQQEEESSRRAEEEATQHADRIARWRKWRAIRLQSEPGPEIKDAVRISLRLLDGERVVRRFVPDAPLEELYAFVECYGLLQETTLDSQVEAPSGYRHEFDFRLVSPVPREVYDVETGGTLRQRIGRSGNLIVERLLMESDEDSDSE